VGRLPEGEAFGIEARLVACVVLGVWTKSSAFLFNARLPRGVMQFGLTDAGTLSTATVESDRPFSAPIRMLRAILTACGPIAPPRRPPVGPGRPPDDRRSRIGTRTAIGTFG
jgi:hypothetical protein